MPQKCPIVKENKAPQEVEESVTIEETHVVAWKLKQCEEENEKL